MTVATGRPAPPRPHGRARRRSPHPQPVRSLPSVLDVDGVTARAPDGTVLLDDVTFSLRRGWLVAVVGPTGAGKTSLANVLSGMGPLERGTIHLEGVDLARADDGVRRRVAYVPQDDVLHAPLDLRRTLEYAAALRTGGDRRGEMVEGRVDGVLTELGLQGCAHLPISILSGGQRKRANVAVELVGDPEVLVLDEPTAGLDPGFEKSVFATLRQLADRGRTVVVVTHSVRALPVCDRVLFLAPGGRVAFFGPPSEASRYFAKTDPADVFLALHDQSGRSWQERFRLHPAYARYVTGSVGGAGTVGAGPAGGRVRRLGRPSGALQPRPARRGQLVMLLRRHLDLLRTDRRNLTMLALAGPLLGLLLWAVLAPGGLRPLGPSRLGLPTRPDPRTVAMFVAVSATWLGAANAIREIVKERRILRREHRAGMSLGVYVTSKFLALGAVTASQAVVLTIVATARQRPPAAGAVFGSGITEIMVAAALAALAAVGLGLLLSALVGSPEKALTILPFVLVTQLVFAGPWSTVSTVPGLRELRSLTSAHWGGQAVRATVSGDATAWWTAAVALVGLTVGALVITHALLQRHNGHNGPRPQEPHGPRRARRCHRRATATPVPRPAWALGAIALVLLSGLGALTTSDRNRSGDAAVSARALGDPTPSATSPAASPEPRPAAPVAPEVASPIVDVAPAVEAGSFTGEGPGALAAPEPVVADTASVSPAPEGPAVESPTLVATEGAEPGPQVDITAVGAPLPSPTSIVPVTVPVTVTVPEPAPVLTAASPWIEFAQWMYGWWFPLAALSPEIPSPGLR